jgi:uncharacterized protein (TIGR02145 family)
MKKAILLLFMLSIAFRLLSADINVTFTATGAASVVDEVTARNLATNASIVLPGSATLILHQVTTGTQLLSDNSGGGTFYPNPFNGKAKLIVDTKQAQTVRLQLIGPGGQILVQKNQYLPSGNHLFTLTGNVPGIYFISLATNEGMISYKALCTGADGGENSILYNGIAISDMKVPGQTQLKNTQAGYQLEFIPGDIILYTCKSNNYKTIIADSPASSKTYSVEFTACTDVDGHNYGVVKIGNQWWMSENLKTTKYRNGDTIPEVTDTTQWMNLYTGASCNYSNNADIGNLYGKLYNWYAVTDSSNIAPEGWHVPEDAEWQTMIDFLGGKEAAGGKMKETDTIFWQSPNIGATNESGFSGLPGGQRDCCNARCFNLNLEGVWWTSTIEQSSAAKIRILDNNYKGISGGWTSQRAGCSVRCVKDKQN